MHTCGVQRRLTTREACEEVVGVQANVHCALVTHLPWECRFRLGRGCARSPEGHAGHRQNRKQPFHSGARTPSAYTRLALPLGRFPA